MYPFCNANVFMTWSKLHPSSVWRRLIWVLKISSWSVKTLGRLFPLRVKAAQAFPFTKTLWMQRCIWWGYKQISISVNCSGLALAAQESGLEHSSLKALIPCLWVQKRQQTDQHASDKKLHTGKTNANVGYAVGTHCAGIVACHDEKGFVLLLLGLRTRVCSSGNIMCGCMS